MTDQNALNHQIARARELFANDRPIEALRTGIGNMMADEFNCVPEHCRASLAGYILFGTQTGRFLTAVLSNDLFGALGQADDINKDRLRDYAIALYNGAPPGSYGSVAAVREWVKSGGVFGQAAPGVVFGRAQGK